MQLQFDPCLICSHGGQGFMPHTAASHQEVIKMCGLTLGELPCCPSDNVNGINSLAPIV